MSRQNSARSSGSTGQKGGGHVIPHAATFRNARDVTRGEAARNLENLRRKEEAARNYISPRTLLKRQLAQSHAFRQSRPEYIGMLVDGASEQTLDSEEVLFEIAEPCEFGETPFYVVLEGQLTIENALEVVLGYVYVGDTVGEGGALGLTEERTATVRCSKDHPSRLLRIEGSALEAAVVAYPEERDHVETIFFKRQAANQDFEQRRRFWVTHTVIPALQGTALLAGCPDDFLYDVAAPLFEKPYKNGQVIARCGEPADSMLLLLEGSAEIEAKSHAKISLLREGACFGEVAALNLFGCRTATIRAVGRCRVLNVTSQALFRAIERSSEDMVKVAFSRLVESRRQQVDRGMPMSALPINARSDDVAVRAVALHSERIDLMPGQTWMPLSDDDACGPHFGVLVKGKALLETIEERRLVTVLQPGSLFPEGMCEEYKTQVRAVTRCEGFRVRQTDFLLAVYSMPSAQEWFYRFRLLDKRTRAHLHSRLSAVRGVTEGVVHCPSDDYIHDWKARRLKAIERSKLLKVQPPKNLPLTVSQHTSLESASSHFRSMSSQRSTASSMKRVMSAPDKLQQDQHSLSVDASAGIQLPRIHTAS